METIHSLKGTIFIFAGEFVAIYCLSNSFRSSNSNHFLEHLQPTIISKVLYIFLMLKFAAIQFGQHSFFSVSQSTIHRETDLLSKQLYLQSSIDYNAMRAAT